MVTGSRPVQVASFGGRKSFTPENAPDSENAAYGIKPTICNGSDSAFESDGDIIDYQTALLQYESGATVSFHTNLNTPDEQRRFFVVGTNGMAEGDFVRGYLTITDAATRGQRTRHDYSSKAEHTGEYFDPSEKKVYDFAAYLEGDESRKPVTDSVAHYGADEMMCNDLARFLRGNNAALPVSIVDALEAGAAALAIDEARTSNTIFDLRPFWQKFDAYNLRRCDG